MSDPDLEAASVENKPRPHPLKEIIDPFIEMMNAPQALWGVNLSYFIEGFVYFGMLTYMVMYFNDYVGLADGPAGMMVGLLTYGITLSMLFLGGLADKWGVRLALVSSLCVMTLGRALMALVPALELSPSGLWSAAHFVAIGGIFLVIIGNGVYQPAAYAAVKQFTRPAGAAMGYAALYALMNLGGFLPAFFGPIRRNYGISGAYWVYVALGTFCVVVTFLLISRRAAREAIARSKSALAQKPPTEEQTKPPKPPFSVKQWLKNHPLANPKFSFFIFSLIPVQTLFAHNWLTLPVYAERAYEGTWIGRNFEAAVNFNPLLIFFLVPIVTALTQRAKVYNMMIWGTLIMAAPTFLLAIGPSFVTLFGYIVIMTIGEAMWQPRFLQYAAEIAPEGRTGAYMGVAQFPWFLTKLITSLYSGWFLAHYCSEEGALHTERMWLIYGLIAISSPILLILARNWAGKEMPQERA